MQLPYALKHQHMQALCVAQRGDQPYCHLLGEREGVATKGLFCCLCPSSCFASFSFLSFFSFFSLFSFFWEVLFSW